MRPAYVSYILLLIVMATGQTLRAQESVRVSLTASLQQGGSELELTWTNANDRSCLLNMGGVHGEKPLYIFRLSVSGPNMRSPLSAAVLAEAAFEGRGDPWVVYMPPQASYSLRIATNQILLYRSGKILDRLKGPWRLTVAYVGTVARDSAPGGRSIPFSLTQNGPTNIPFCAGSLSAEVKHE